MYLITFVFLIWLVYRETGVMSLVSCIHDVGDGINPNDLYLYMCDLLNCMVMMYSLFIYLFMV